MSETASKNAAPIHEIRLGAIRAAIWARQNETDGRSWLSHTVTITRSYKDGGQWKHTASFRRDDLPLVAKVADLAHVWIYTEAPKLPEA